MKLLCIQDHKTVKSGFLWRDETQEKIEGLTNGKVYHAQSGIMSDNNSIANGTIINGDDNYFLVYNDNSEWHLYELFYFKPAEEV